MNFKFIRNIRRLNPSKRPLKILETRGRECIQGLPIFWISPIIAGTGKAKNLKFCEHIHRIARNKSPLKIFGKVTVGVLRGSQKFSGHAPIYRAHRAVIFAIAQLSCFILVAGFCPKNLAFARKMALPDSPPP